MPPDRRDMEAVDASPSLRPMPMLPMLPMPMDMPAAAGAAGAAAAEDVVEERGEA